VRPARITRRFQRWVAAALAVAAVALGLWLWAAHRGRSVEIRIGAVAVVDPRIPASVKVAVLDGSTVRITFGSHQRPTFPSTPGLTMWDAQTRVSVAGLPKGTKCGSDESDLYVGLLRWWRGRDNQNRIRPPVDLITTSDARPARRRADVANGAHVDIKLDRDLEDDVCVGVSGLVGNGATGFGASTQYRRF
jgi:hypothetical protein